MDLIVAADLNWGIGYAGTQPIVLPEDRKRFRDITSGGTVIMGHTTLGDFPDGRPLKNRDNIVMSKNTALKIDGAKVIAGIQGVFEAVDGRDPRKVFVIGGESIYRQLMDYCLYAYVTQIMGEYDADRYFPNLDENIDWALESEGPLLAHEGVNFRFLRYINMKIKEFKLETE